MLPVSWLHGYLKAPWRWHLRKDPETVKSFLCLCPGLQQLTEVPSLPMMTSQPTKHLKIIMWNDFIRMELLQEDAGTFLLASWHMLASKLSSLGGFPTKLPVVQASHAAFSWEIKLLPVGVHLFSYFICSLHIFLSHARYWIGPGLGAGHILWIRQGWHWWRLGRWHTQRA